MEVKYCPKCGASVPENANFCLSCGTNLSTIISKSTETAAISSPITKPRARPANNTSGIKENVEQLSPMAYKTVSPNNDPGYTKSTKVMLVILAFGCLCFVLVTILWPATPAHDTGVGQAWATSLAPQTEKPAKVATTAPTSIPVSTSTPAKVATSAPTKTPTATLEPTNTELAIPKTGLLPGLQPADVKLNLENRQFTCELVYTPTGNDPTYKWECKRENTQYYMLVEIWSKSLLTVDLIKSNILQFGEPDNALSAEFLGFMATMPYDGAEPEKARTWVENTLPTITENGDVREATFGGVKFELYGIPTARLLNIGE